MRFQLSKLASAAIVTSAVPMALAAQSSPDSISLMRFPGHIGAAYIVTLIRDGHVRYTDLDPRLPDRPHLDWRVSSPVADSLWSLFPALGIDSLLYPDKGGFIPGCVGGVADAPGIQVTTFAAGRRRSGLAQLPCSLPFIADSLPMTVRQFYMFAGQFENLTGAAARWRTDHPEAK